jgi:hypothetical protein
VLRLGSLLCLVGYLVCAQAGADQALLWGPQVIVAVFLAWSCGRPDDPSIAPARVVR